MRWNHRKLEEIHDYIQWLFPLPEESMVSDAPLVDEDVFAAFHASSELQSEVKKSLVKMLNFYGLKFADDLDEENSPVIVKASNFNDRCGNWLVSYNHNHLRISRILRSLRVLGLELEAAAFYKVLSNIIYQKHGQVVNNRSTEYWRRSAERPLQWAPDMTEDEDLQQQHDAKRALEEEKEAEFQATKAHFAHIAALEVDRKRKVDGAKFSPQSRSSTSQKSRIYNYQLGDKEAVIADTLELTTKPQEVVAEKDEASYNEPELIRRKASEAGNEVHEQSDLIEQKVSDAGETTHNESRLIEQASKVGEATPDESNVIEQEVSKVCEATQDESNLVGRKASEASGHSVIRQIQQYQLLAPRQP
ncbi:hypothetical protein DID88_000552 [Monilinia fructigena]|uniref:Opioid growth factor receptor (OGFr) conserved domain-containing protein n=1 Tax=Monilinia fructigena TaxID=38457 RepID=A0A395IID0_9HELO|nr:hypothetical protein DID88_000552 [Monilinia fructigena]